MIKKIAIVFIVLIIGIPLTTSAFTLEPNNHLTTGNYEQNISPLNDPPDWATHQFIGVIGLTDFRGQPLRPSHITMGYCTESFSDTFVGVVTERNQTEPSGYLGGKVMGPFFLGRLSADRANERGMTIAGIGIHNETHFYYRFIGLRGPSLYFAGQYYPIE